ncbi:hypothetical protein EVA_04505 [gut metagenome]|uniref:Uncharacterized protein n=1 Tax=gut metagenome TaxID=749906 RepID=J9D3Z4_9ZZZZ
MLIPNKRLIFAAVNIKKVLKKGFQCELHAGILSVFLSLTPFLTKKIFIPNQSLWLI